MLEDSLTLPSNGKLYSKVLNWVQRSLWENGDQLERLMEEVSIRVPISQADHFHFLPCLFLYLVLYPTSPLSLSHSLLCVCGFDMKESFRVLN